VASYSLGELSTPRLRYSAVEELWAYTGDVLIIVEPGSPEGNRTIMDIRNMFVNSNGGQSQAELVLGRVPTTLTTPAHIVSPVCLSTL